MDPERRKFGSGPREPSGAKDVMHQYGVFPFYEEICKSSLSFSISDTKYLCKVVGDTEIRKGEGMQLDQLIQNSNISRDTNVEVKPFDLGDLFEAFHLKEATPVVLPQSEKGTPTVEAKPKSDSNEKDQKVEKHKNGDQEKDKGHKKHKHCHKCRGEKQNEAKKDKSEHHNSDSKGRQDKKRKHGGDEDNSGMHRHKKNKHKSGKVDEVDAAKVAG